MLFEEINAATYLLIFNTIQGDSIRRNGGMTERWNRMAEHTKYSKIRNTRNILKHGIYGIF